MRTTSVAIEMDEGPAIVPFWQRVSRFFLYPLRVEPLLYMLFLSALTALSFLLPLPSPLDLMVVLFLVWLAFFRYAYKILARTARGRLDAGPSWESEGEINPYLPYKQYGVFICMGWALSAAEHLGTLLFGAALLFCMVAIPASVMTLTLTGRLRSAINPLTLMETMSAIGLPYLGLCAFLFLLTASHSAALHLFLPRLPSMLLLPAFNFLGMYFTLIMFNMMGYVAYQYHRELGVDVQRPKSDPADEKRGAIGRLVADGQIDQALDIAYEEARVAPDDMTAQQRYHKLLLLADKKDRLAAHGRRYLSALLNKGRGGEALVLYRNLAGQLPEFTPEKPSELLRLAEAARQERDYAYALGLIKGFDKRFPGHPEIPEVYLFAARVFCEHLRQDENAARILRVLLQRYPQHPASAEGGKLLAVIERMAAGRAEGAG